MNKRIEGTNERIDSLRLSVDKKIDDVNKRIEGMDTRLNSRIEGMDVRLNGKIEETDTRLNRRIDSNFKWMLGRNSFTLNLSFKKKALSKKLYKRVK